MGDVVGRCELSVSLLKEQSYRSKAVPRPLPTPVFQLLSLCFWQGVLARVIEEPKPDRRTHR